MGRKVKLHLKSSRLHRWDVSLPTSRFLAALGMTDFALGNERQKQILGCVAPLGTTIPGGSSFNFQHDERAVVERMPPVRKSVDRFQNVVGNAIGR